MPIAFILIVGFSSVFAQSLLVRELIVAFGGNEMSIGIILGSWLFWTGAGSFAYARSQRAKPVSCAPFTQFIFALLIIVEFLLIRNIRPILGFLPGEIIGPGVMLTVGWFILAPFAIVNGFLFYLGIVLVSRPREARSIGFVYSIDAAGDMLGGVLFSFVFVFLLSSLGNAYLAAVINIICAAALVMSGRYVLRQKISILVAITCLSIFCVMFPSAFRRLASREWKGFNVVSEKNTRYGNLCLTRNQGLYALFANGMLSFTFPSVQESEEDVHFVFPQSPKVERILTIGEGVGGALRQMLKYPVDKIYYLELDPELVPFVARYLPAQDRRALDDKRVEIIGIEARAFFRRWQGDQFDVIILSTPPPYTAYLNRFYTYEFFCNVKRFLKTEGVFSFTVPSRGDYLPRELRDFNVSIYRTLKRVFPYVVCIPGEKLRFIASASGQYLTLSPEKLGRRLADYGITNTFVDISYYKSRLLPWHIRYLESVFGGYKNVRINYDFFPITYYYGIGFFSAQFPRAAGVLQLLKYIPSFFYFLFVFIIWLATYRFRRQAIFGLYALSTGFAGMAAVILSILGFQLVYGYVYHKVGLISAFFMLGAALSAGFMNRMNRVYNPLRLAALSLVIGGYIFFVPYFFYVLAKMPFLGEGLSFCVPLGMGCLIGAGFPAANMLYLQRKQMWLQGAGVIYAWDMLGGSLCGVFLSIIAVPLYGLFVSSFFVCCMSVLTGCMMIGYAKGAKINL